MKKLNLGCGFDKREGFVNADNFLECQPDIMCDLEAFPWPFEDNEFDYILMKHVLEHVGSQFSVFKKIMQELYRISSPDGIIEIQVPHFSHNTFWSDPTHVRGFTDLTFRMMSKKQNDVWIAKRANYSMLAYMMNVDFEVAEASHIYDQAWLNRENAGEITRAQLRQAAQTDWGVIKELHVKLKVVKEVKGEPRTKTL
jgi:predicted SAM-dependent methyltransferase